MQTKQTIRQRIEQGNLAFQQENFEEAKEIFEEVLLQNPKFPDVHNKMGLCRAMLGDEEGAVESFDTALGLAPDYAEAHANRGIILTELGRHDEARESFEKSSALDTREGTDFPSQMGNKIALAHAELGDLYVVAEMPDEAAVQYRRSLEVRPRFLDIRVKLAEALLDIEANQQAREQLELVLDEKPGFVNARLRLGQALQRLGDTDGAVRQWEHVVEQRPDDMRAKAFLARARGEGKD